MSHHAQPFSFTIVQGYQEIWGEGWGPDNRAVRKQNRVRKPHGDPEKEASGAQEDNKGKALRSSVEAKGVQGIEPGSGCRSGEDFGFDPL